MVAIALLCILQIINMGVQLAGGWGHCYYYKIIHVNHSRYLSSSSLSYPTSPRFCSRLRRRSCVSTGISSSSEALSSCACSCFFLRLNSNSSSLSSPPLLSGAKSGLKFNKCMLVNCSKKNIFT